MLVISNQINNDIFIFFSTKRGEFWRLLSPGQEYTMTVTADGYKESQPILVDLKNSKLIIENVSLQPENPNEE